MEGRLFDESAEDAGRAGRFQDFPTERTDSHRRTPADPTVIVWTCGPQGSRASKGDRYATRRKFVASP